MLPPDSDLISILTFSCNGVHFSCVINARGLVCGRNALRSTGIFTVLYVLSYTLELYMYIKTGFCFEFQTMRRQRTEVVVELRKVRTIHPVSCSDSSAFS